MKTMLAVVIVNYRTAQLTCDCLASLCDQRRDFDSFSVVVVDNNSGDDSLFIINEYIAVNKMGEWVSVLPVSINGGFAAGNNAAITLLIESEYCPEYILLLNPDTVVKPYALLRLVDFLDLNQDVGIVGAQLHNAQGNLDITARRYPTIVSELINGAELGVLTKILDKWQVSLPLQNHPCRCDWVSGAAMMIRSKLFRQIGLMDDGFFLYFEEVDLCRRAKMAGWQIWLDPSSVIIHLEGQATGIQDRRKRRAKYWFDSRRRFFVKHYGVLYWMFADLLWGVGRASLYVRKFLRLGGAVSTEPRNFFLDLLLGDLKALLIGDVFRIHQMLPPFYQKMFPSRFPKKSGGNFV